MNKTSSREARRSLCSVSIVWEGDGGAGLALKKQETQTGGLQQTGRPLGWSEKFDLLHTTLEKGNRAWQRGKR